MFLALDEERASFLNGLGWTIILIIAVLIGAIAFVVAWAILKSAERPAPTLLVMSLSMLTLLSIVAFVASGSQEMGTLAGVGLGALAAAVSTMFGKITANDTLPPPEEHHPPPPEEQYQPEDPYVEDPPITAHDEKTDEGA